MAAIESVITGNGPSGTDLRVESADGDGNRRCQLLIRVSRVLQPDRAAPSGEAGQPCLFATWRLPDGTRVRSTLATAQYTQAPGQ